MVFMTCILISSAIFLLLKHPMSLGLILLIQTVMVALTMGFFNMTFWYSYILFLIMIGGMLVLFIYMTSVASNEKFMFSIKITILISSLIILMAFFYSMMDPYFSNINNLNMESLNSDLTYSSSLNKYLTKPMNIILIMLIIYLLITLIAVVKITDIKSGPLRQLY
uniref:NADH-ubiquinone oxidoreductase chain 6 n=1 Tax=Melolontha hippocastani TaxID=903833 RepID=A0A343C398_9SCAR|nr:NADH dehydrogenase subunit 6 [Melolontha hippocastani]